jgi:signal peptidase II
VLIILIVFFILEKNKTLLFCSSIALIISGAIGNILDRILGKEGVVDFVYIGSDRYFRWPAFNVADSVIVAGAFLLFIVFYKEEKKRKQLKESQG